MSTVKANRPSPAAIVGEMVALKAYAAGIGERFTICIVGGEAETAAAHQMCREGTIDGYVSLADGKGGNVEIVSYARTNELDALLAKICEEVSARLVGMYRPSAWQTWRGGGKGGAA